MKSIRTLFFSPLFLFFLLILVLVPVAGMFFFKSDIRLISYLQSIQSRPVMYSLISFVLLTSDVILPVPSSVILWMNGWVLGLGYGSLLSLFSTTISGCIGYGIGYWGLKNKQAPLWSFEKFHKHAFPIVLFSRGIPMLSEAISILSGVYKLKPAFFLLYNLLGYLPVCILFAFLGTWDQYQEHFFNGLLIALLITLLIWWIGRRYLTP